MKPNKCLIENNVAKEVFNTEGIFSSMWYNDYTFAEYIHSKCGCVHLYSILFTLQDDALEVATANNLLINCDKQLLN